MININKLIAKQCNFICTYAEIEDDYSIAKIKYGLQCIYGDGSKLLLILILFAVLNSLDCFAVLMLLLISRTLLGGSHCKSYGSCLIFSSTVSLSLLFVSSKVNLHNIFVEIICIGLLTTLTLSKKLIQNPQRPKKSYTQLQKHRGLALVIIYSFLLLSNLFLNERLITFGFLTTVFILFDYIFRRDDYEKQN